MNTQQSFWLLPSNEAGFRLSDALRAQDGKVYWRNNNGLKVGDTVLIYSTRPEQRVKYVMEVVEAKIPTAQRPFDQKQFWNKHDDFEKDEKKMQEIIKNDIVKILLPRVIKTCPSKVKSLFKGNYKIFRKKKKRLRS